MDKSGDGFCSEAGRHDRGMNRNAVGDVKGKGQIQATLSDWDIEWIRW